MLALHDVVATDLRSQVRDRSAYMAWVESQYVAELDRQQRDLYESRQDLAEEKSRLEHSIAKKLNEKQQAYARIAKHDSSLWRAQSEYFQYLYETDIALWRVLDPVISVHPDATLFEGFSLDESSYARVTTPMENLNVRGSPAWGTTNIDFSESLARAFQRVRSYRPAILDIGVGTVTAGTASDMAIEKKIDLPPSWVRSFLQVQSASAMKGLTVYLSSETLSRVIAVLRRHRERQGPRSLHFQLRHGSKPRITINPWGIVIEEWQHVYDGREPADICVWGRRRLFCLERLLPHTREVVVRLLGSGMPSYWSVNLRGHRFDLGLSGWTANDWATQARFASFVSPQVVDGRLLARARDILQRELLTDPKRLGTELRVSRRHALAALQTLCQHGDAMFDLQCEAYRWRQLLAPEDRTDAGMTDDVADNIGEILLGKGVRVVGRPTMTPRGNSQYTCEATIRKTFKPVLDIDTDGRVVNARCNCSYFRRNKLRLGPCPHLLAAPVYISQAHHAVAGATT